MKKQLEIGKNYKQIFPNSRNDQLIYKGGIEWTATYDNNEVTMESEEITNKALELLNRPNYGAGRWIS